jgi:hypothetical protein
MKKKFVMWKRPRKQKYGLGTRIKFGKADGTSIEVICVECSKCRKEVFVNYPAEGLPICAQCFPDLPQEDQVAAIQPRYSPDKC